jgi:hypothetical protein
MTNRDLPRWMQLNLGPNTIGEVVTRLNRVRPKARKKLAEDVVTIAYLEAGRRLIERHIQGSTTAENPHDFLGWLTRDVVCAEVQQGPDLLPRQASDGTFRDRWRNKDDYLADLIAYLYWSAHREPNRQLAQDVVAALLSPKTPLANASEEAAYQDLLYTIDSRLAGIRLTQIAIQPLASMNPTTRTTIGNMYAEIVQVWGETYRRVLDGRRMRLRPDVAVEDVAIILNAVADGLAMRAHIEGTDRIMDHETHTGLLGTVALALLLACVDHGDGGSMRDLVNELGRSFPPITQPNQDIANSKSPDL